LGSIPAGTYTTKVFQPTITYHVPSGWGNFEDTPGNFLLIPPGGNLAGVDPGTSDYIGIYTHIIADKPDCSGPAPVGDSPSAIANWYSTQRALEISTPQNVSVGGLDGVVFDVKLAKGSQGACLFEGVAPSSLEHGIGPGLVMRLYLLHRAGTLAIEVDDAPGGGSRLDAYSSVVQEIRFGT
jgi:hypothetical protein